MPLPNRLEWRMHNDDTFRLGRQIAEINAAVPGIVANRMIRMATAGAKPSRADRTELSRMSSEKWEAASQSAVAAAAFTLNLQMAATQAFWQTAMSPWLGTPTNRSSANGDPITGLMSAALAPYHRIATANAKRLRKR